MNYQRNSESTGYSPAREFVSRLKLAVRSLAGWLWGKIPPAFRTGRGGLALIFLVATAACVWVNIQTSLAGFGAMGGGIMQLMIVPFLLTELFVLVRLVTPAKDFNTESLSIKVGIVLWVITAVLNGILTWLAISMEANVKGTVPLGGSIAGGLIVAVVIAAGQIVCLTIFVNLGDRLLRDSGVDRSKTKQATLSVVMVGIVASVFLYEVVNFLTNRAAMQLWISSWATIVAFAIWAIDAAVTVARVVFDDGEEHETEEERATKWGFIFFAFIGGAGTFFALYQGTVSAGFIREFWVRVIVAGVMSLVLVAARVAVVAFAVETYLVLKGRGRGSRPAARKAATQAQTASQAKRSDTPLDLSKTAAARHSHGLQPVAAMPVTPVAAQTPFVQAPRAVAQPVPLKQEEPPQDDDDWAWLRELGLVPPEQMEKWKARLTLIAKEEDVDPDFFSSDVQDAFEEAQNDEAIAYKWFVKEIPTNVEGLLAMVGASLMDAYMAGLKAIGKEEDGQWYAYLDEVQSFVDSQPADRSFEAFSEWRDNL